MSLGDHLVRNKEFALQRGRRSTWHLLALDIRHKAHYDKAFRKYAHHKAANRHKCLGSSSHFRSLFLCKVFSTSSCRRSTIALGPQGCRADTDQNDIEADKDEGMLAAVSSMFGHRNGAVATGWRALG